MEGFWSDADLDLLERCYANCVTDDLAFMLGRSARAVHLKARQLGISKSEEMKSKTRFKKGQVGWNKGMKGISFGGKATQFKKGGTPPNTLPIGSTRVVWGVLQRKINNNRGNSSVRWRGVHELVWIAHNGAVPPGHIVVFQPGKKTLVEAEITIDRVECISLAENMRRNTRHNYGPELAALMALRGALNRKINAAVNAAVSQ